MYPEALGVALRVAKHLGTILTSLETVWDNLKKIEKNRFFPSNFLKSLAVLSFASGNFLTGFQKSEKKTLPKRLLLAMIKKGLDIFVTFASKKSV